MKLGHAATHIAVQSAPRSMKCPVTCRPSLFHRVLASRTSKRPCPTVPAPSPKMKSSNLCPGRMSSGKKDNNSHALSFFFDCHPELPSRLARRLSYKVIINNQQPLLSRSIYYIIIPIPIEKNYSVVPSASSRYVCKHMFGCICTRGNHALRILHIGNGFQTTGAT